MWQGNVTEDYSNNLSFYDRHHLTYRMSHSHITLAYFLKKGAHKHSMKLYTLDVTVIKIYKVILQLQ